MMNAGMARMSARLRVVIVGLKFVAKGRVGDVVTKPARRVVSSSSESGWSFARRGVRDDAMVRQCVTGVEY